MLVGNLDMFSSIPYEYCYQWQTVCLSCLWFILLLTKKVSEALMFTYGHQFSTWVFKSSCRRNSDVFVCLFVFHSTDSTINDLFLIIIVRTLFRYIVLYVPQFRTFRRCFCVYCSLNGNNNKGLAGTTD